VPAYHSGTSHPRQPPRPLPIALSAEAFEAERVVAIGTDLTAVLEPRSALPAALANFARLFRMTPGEQVLHRDL
jgi:hypothetical protein